MTPVLIAAAVLTEPVADSTAVLLAYGPLGVFAIIAIISGRVVWKRFSDLLTAATARAEAAEARNDVLVSRLMDQAAASLPLLTRVADQLDRATRESR